MQNVNKNIPQSIPCSHCGNESVVIPMIVDDGTGQIIPVICDHCGMVSCLEELEPGLFANRLMVGYEPFEVICALSKWVREAAKDELKAMQKKNPRRKDHLN